MPNYTPQTLPQTTSLEMLRQFVTAAFNRISLQLSQSDRRTQPMSMGGNRLSDVPDPVNALDAVNLRTLKKELQGIGNKFERKQAPKVGEESTYFSVVWANSGTASSGTGIPPYVFNPNRLGTPGLFKAYAIGTGTGSTTVNWLYLPQGNGAGTRMLSSDLVIGAGAHGPVSANNFAIAPSFAANDVVYPVIDVAGGCSVFSLEMLVNP
jgi:hypothetical protein